MKTVLIQLNSNSLGDTIGVMPCVEKFMSTTTDKVLLKVNPRFINLFTETYPSIQYYSEGMLFDKKIELDYDFTQPLQTGFAKQLGFHNWEYIRPQVTFKPKERPIKSKYVTISIHSTSQLKYWNNPLGIKTQPMSPNWNDLCGMLRKSGYTPVIVEKDEMFGWAPYRNGMPNKANKKLGDRKSTRLNSSHTDISRMPSSA